MAMSPSQLANFRRRTGGGPDPRPSPRSNQGVGPSNRYGRRSPIESSKAFDSSSRSPLGSASSPAANVMRARQARAFAGRTANGGNSLGRMAFGGPNRGGNQTGSPALQPSQPSGYAMNNMTSGGDLAKAYYNNQKTQLPTTPATTPAATIKPGGVAGPDGGGAGFPAGGPARYGDLTAVGLSSLAKPPIAMKKGGKVPKSSRSRNGCVMAGRGGKYKGMK